jgi:hypothetical protein
LRAFGLAAGGRLGALLLHASGASLDEAVPAVSGDCPVRG